jgi:hypothetical protein
MNRLVLASLMFLSISRPMQADSVVVFNEIMYHPATNEPGLEWIELFNQQAVDVDLSGWRLTQGIDYVFPAGTIIQGTGYLVVAVSPAALTAATGITNVTGPFAGRLANAGEELRLRNVADRLMDRVVYGVDGDWPVSPDGAGTSLAKRHPNMASRPAESWTASRQLGGTPGAANFTTVPLLAPATNVLPVTADWRFDDTGIDLGTEWRLSAFDDSAWSSGAGLFYVEEGALPAPKNTPLAPNRSTYYFRGRFQLDGDPADKIVTVRPIIDDGAVLYVNGTEVWRLNMPAGPMNHATMASAAVGNADFSGAFTLPAGALQSGENVVAVEVHQTTVTTNAGLRISTAAGSSVLWDGGDGDFFSAAAPALAPTNAALATLGVEVFTSSNTNAASNINDGRYGQGSSWSPAPSDTAPFIVLRFNQAMPVSSIAWSRDNGDATDAGCVGGGCTDRSLGNYTFQYTLVANPAAVVNSSANPSNGWTTLATVQYLSAQPGFSPHLRHRFDFLRSNAVIMATGIRLRPAASNTIDEIEINPPVAASFDAVFGLELATQEILPPPPQLVFNEVAGASSTGFWLEIMNAGDTPAELGGVRIVRSGASPGYQFAPQILPPGGLRAVTQAEMGFGAFAGDALFLYTAGGHLALDAVTVRTNARGRSPDGTGSWQFPAQPTPGAANLVALRDDVVFNEIMYRAAPFDPEPAVTTNRIAITITNSWRYHDLGVDPGAAWKEPGYNDTAWGLGRGLLSFNASGLPAPTNATLSGGHVTYYFRTTFDFAGATTDLTLDLRTVVDDGAVFYLNGHEIYRHNMPAGPVSATTSASAPVGDAGFAGPIALPPTHLVQGNNVLAVEVHQVTPATTSSGIVLTGGGLTLVEEGPFGGAPPMNLARLPGATPFVIDSLVGYPIHNFTGLTDGVYGNNNSWIGNSGNPGYAGVRFGGLFTINSVAFGRDNTGTFADRTLGIYTLQYTRVATPDMNTSVTGNPDTGWATIGTMNYQAAGTGLFANPSRRHRFAFTPVEATGIRLVVPGTGIGGNGTCIDELEINPPDTSGDVAFGAELALTTTLVPAQPFADATEEWIELHNRGSQPVDLTGWRLDNAADYRFATGSVIQAGGYLVVANDADTLHLKWPEVAARIVGNFTGGMGNGEEVSLKDASGNLVDLIHVRGRHWSRGGGSSLELIDPRAENDHREAWADSDESGKSEWQTFTYRMIAGQRFGNVFWNEFRIGMLDAGEALLDDISLVRDPDGARQQLIQNGDFEAIGGNTHWRMLGNHGASEIMIDPANPANRVLKVSSSGPSRTSHNHIETSFVNNTPLVDGQEYEVSFRARWLAGSPQLNTCAYLQKLARTTILPVPRRHGTPGAVNSRHAANRGPLFSALKHAPVVPAINEPVTISVQASDPDGVTAAALHYRVNPAVAFTSIAMTQQVDGTWAAVIPGQTAGRIVHFYVAANDGASATAFAPPDGPAARALYQVADGQGANVAAHELRLIQLDVDRDALLLNTNVMSQARLGGTVIYDRAEIFYEVQVRLHGSAAGRARDGENYISYDIEFPPDQLFRGVQGNVGIDRSGRAPVVRQQHEIFILHMFQRAGLPTHHSDLCYFIAPRTAHSGTVILQLGAYNGLFVEEQFNTEGSTFNFDLTYEPSTTVGGDYEAPKLPVPLQAHIGTDFADLGPDKEQYRAPFDIRYGERADDYSGIMRLCRVMGLPQPEFDAQIAGVLDVDEALRVTALTILCGLGDIYFSATPSLPHNSRIFTPVDGPAQFLPWDMDFVFTQPANGSIFPTTSVNLSKLLNHPHTRRLYLWQVNDLCETVFNPTYMTPWLTHYGGVVGHDYTGSASYIQSRRAAALSQLPAVVPFSITSSNGQGFTIATNLIVLSGTGWLDVKAIEINGVPHAINWATSTNWSLTVPLVPGTNLLTVQGLDRAGNRAPNLVDFIAITNTLPSTRLPVVINEWMADAAGPGGLADPADGLFQDWFELFNPNDTAVDLGGYHLTDDLLAPTKWAIPANTTISPHGFLLVWADENSTQNSPTNSDLHAGFRLSADGEALGLFAPDGVTPEHTVTFGPQAENVSRGLYPDGATDSLHSMPDWTPRAPNRVGSPASPRIVGITVSPNTATFIFTATPGRTYRVEYKDDLNAADWTSLGNLKTSPVGTITVTENVVPLPQRFFRLRQL